MMLPSRSPAPALRLTYQTSSRGVYRIPVIGFSAEKDDDHQTAGADHLQPEPSLTRPPPRTRPE
jgi:hypothetical protein